MDPLSRRGRGRDSRGGFSGDSFSGRRGREGREGRGGRGGIGGRGDRGGRGGRRGRESRETQEDGGRGGRGHGICRSLQQTGHCRFGAECSYSHDLSDLNVEDTLEQKARADYNSWKRLIKNLPKTNDIRT